MSVVARLPQLVDVARPLVSGCVTEVRGLSLEVAGVSAAVGEEVVVRRGTGPLAAEVVAVNADRLVCLPLGTLHGVRAGDRVTARGAVTAPVGAALLGRVVDGSGQPIDGKPPLTAVPRTALEAAAPAPLSRDRITAQVGLGVRALDTLVPCGRGQRLGIFAGSGVGKSSLLSMIARGTSADVTVLALIGERGREVREFLEHDLGEEGLARSIVVVSTSDQPAPLRLRAAALATRIAESFRDEGKDVVLLLDSLTRVAMAQREVGLSAGEPPATRGYPPSVFALLPRLLERTGPAPVGSITALYTVLVEGDDMNDPIADTARSILDGHVVLTRALATAGHYPSIDVLESVSRTTGTITSPEQRAVAGEVRRLLAAYRDAKDLIEIGAYVPGSNPLVDRAVAEKPRIDAFLRQPVDTTSTVNEAWQALASVMVP